MIIRIILTAHTCQAVIMRENFLLSFLEKAELVEIMLVFEWIFKIL